MGFYFYCVENLRLSVYVVFFMLFRIRITQRTTFRDLRGLLLLSFEAELVVLLEGNYVLLC